MSRKVDRCIEEEKSARSGVLVGRFDHALDPKKRFTIPSEWRALMGDPQYVYVLPDPNERCLDLVPVAEMEMRLAKLRDKALFDPAANRALQTIGAISELPTLDIQGRIRISDKLLQFANLTTTVAMLGSVRMVKLWNPAAAPAADVDQAALANALSAVEF